MKTLIVGANGRIGKRLVKLLKERGHEPVAMLRSSEQSGQFTEQGIEVVIGDLEHPVDCCVNGIEAVVFTAGSGSKTGRDKTILVDHLGAIRMITTAEFAGIKRFIMVSAIGASSKSEHPTIAHYMKAKGWADEFLMERDLDWTIVKPGSLREEPGTGCISLSADFGHSGKISLDDVAATVAESIERPETFKRSIEILEGNTPIAEALQSLQ